MEGDLRGKSEWRKITENKYTTTSNSKWYCLLIDIGKIYHWLNRYWYIRKDNSHRNEEIDAWEKHMMCNTFEYSGMKRNWSNDVQSASPILDVDSEICVRV